MGIVTVKRFCVLGGGLAVLAGLLRKGLPPPLPPPTPLSSPASVLVLGGTGAVGTAVLNELLASGSVGGITSVSRRKHPTLQHPKIKELIVDMSTPAALASALADNADAFDGHSMAFVTLGVGAASKVTASELNTTDHLLPAAFMRALPSTVQHLSLLSAVLANPDAADSGESTGGGSGTYNKIKGELERTAASLNPGTLRIFQPAVILGTPHTPAALAHLGPVLQPLLPGWLRFTHVDDIAAGMVATALRCAGDTDALIPIQVLAVPDYMAAAGRRL